MLNTTLSYDIERGGQTDSTLLFTHESKLSNIIKQEGQLNVLNSTMYLLIGDEWMLNPFF